MKQFLKVIVFFYTILLVGCSEEEKIITFNFPKGFRGLILIREDEKVGDLIVEVSNKGLGYVSDISMFSNWHKLSYTFDEEPHEGLVFEHLAVYDNRDVYLYLGEEKYFLALQKSFDLSKEKMGSVKTVPDNNHPRASQ